MADTPDLDALARRYLDLWQEQMTGMATDPKAMDIMARTMELMNAGAASFAAMAPSPRRPDDAAPDAPPAPPPPSSGPPPPAPASGASDASLDQLRGRVAELEKRIADLESKTEKCRDLVGRKPSKGRSGTIS